MKPALRYWIETVGLSDTEARVMVHVESRKGRGIGMPALRDHVAGHHPHPPVAEVEQSVKQLLASVLIYQDGKLVERKPSLYYVSGRLVSYRLLGSPRSVPAR